MEKIDFSLHGGSDIGPAQAEVRPRMPPRNPRGPPPDPAPDGNDGHRRRLSGTGPVQAPYAMSKKHPYLLQNIVTNRLNQV
ncbi:MAG: hypothetical protein M0P13_07460 [Fibrobacteraceae bacterium]|nr:hypothetical protein [Fibrobacteraceae bacterium]